MSKAMLKVVLAAVICLSRSCCWARCPMSSGGRGSADLDLDNDDVDMTRLPAGHRALIASGGPPRSGDVVNYAAVAKDIEKLLTESNPYWPADEFNGVSNYGPLMIRQVSHIKVTSRMCPSGVVVSAPIKILGAHQQWAN